MPLKVAYKKLRLLVDLGCIFVGHGLSKDFRTISANAFTWTRTTLTSDIFVPPDQVLDTVSIYSMPGSRRKLSLRFLSWYILKKDIQTSTHDSIEDARYALLLYRKFLEYESAGTFDDVMEDVFNEGHKIVSTCAPVHRKVNRLTRRASRLHKTVRPLRHPQPSTHRP